MVRSKLVQSIGLGAVLAALLTVPGYSEDAPGQLYPEALLGQNPLVMRFFMKVPQLVHVSLTDRDDKFTVSRLANGSLKQVPGHYGEPFLMVHPSAAELAQVYDAVKDGKVDHAEKLALAALYANFTEKPFQPPASAEVAAPEAAYLTPYEQGLAKVSGISKKMRWLFNKTMTAPNQFWKLYYGLQIRVLTAISNKASEGLLEKVAEEVSADIDRGQVAIKAGSLFDQLAGIVCLHVMVKDEDMQCYNAILKGLQQRLQGEAGGAKLDGPPAGGNPGDHAEAAKIRLETVKKLQELVQTGG